MFLNQENAVDLLGVSRVPNPRGEGRKYTDRIKTWALLTTQPSLQWSPFFLGFFVYNKPKAKFTHSCNTQDTAYSRWMYHLILQAENTTELQPNVFLSRIHRLLVKEQRSVCLR